MATNTHHRVSDNAAVEKKIKVELKPVYCGSFATTVYIINIEWVIDRHFFYVWSVFSAILMGVGCCSDPKSNAKMPKQGQVNL